MANTDTIFTKIIKRELPAKIEYEDDEFIAFRDIHPKAPVHVLIVPKAAYASLEEIPLEDTQSQAKLLQIVRKVAKKLGILDNYKIAMNVGPQVQAVQHLHIHLMGGWKKINTPEEVEVGF